jgi:hypothetical protein
MPVNVALKLEEGQNVVVVTAIDADGITQQEMRAVVYDKVTPLAIQFRHPEERARVTDEASVAAAVATSSQGVIEVNVILNGTQVFQQRERSPKKSIAIAAPIKLREGANSIVVRATSRRRPRPAGSAHGHLRAVHGAPRGPDAAPARDEPRPVGRRHRRGTLCQPRHSVAAL